MIDLRISIANEGAQAYADGAVVCPYSSGWECDAWRAGWECAHYSDRNAAHRAQMWDRWYELEGSK